MLLLRGTTIRLTRVLMAHWVRIAVTKETQVRAVQNNL